MRRVVVRGAGDVGSAVAVRLFTAGYAVIIHDDAAPTTSRRLNAFTDALFDGEAILAGVRAIRVDDANRVPELLGAHEVIPVHTGALEDVLKRIHPAVLVDARMRKRAIPELQRGLAPLVVGLGPNFFAGRDVGANVDIAIETSWEDLGRIITSGPTMPLQGEPRPLGGHSRDRFVYAPIGGIFRTERRIGDTVAEGEVVGDIEPTSGQADGEILSPVPLLAPLTGTLRGLTHDGVPVAQGTKVIEVDPRGGTIQDGIGERPGKIAEGVLMAITGHGTR